MCVLQVFLGAAAVTANGTVLSRTGTAAVAMVAHEWRMPVMICCETCKFQEKVQLDSICCNELGNPDAVSRVQGKPELRELQVRRAHAKLDAMEHSGQRARERPAGCGRAQPGHPPAAALRRPHLLRSRARANAGLTPARLGFGANGKGKV